MTRTHRYFIILMVLMTSLFSACDHDTDSFDGPNLIDRFGDFAQIENLAVSQSTVDFAAGEEVSFTARFNKSISWVIEITGMESGAIKRIEGFSTDLIAENAVWKGGTSELPFFKAEKCSIELLVPEEPGFSDTGEVEALSAKVYEGSLFTDFEEDAGVNIQVGDFEFELSPQTGRQNSLPAAQGEYYYFMEGADNSNPNFFVGLATINSSVTGEIYAPVPTTVPEDLYFNSFIYSDGGPHGIAVINFFVDTNDSGAFETDQDNSFKLEGDFPLSWEGWRHINHPMSDIGISQEQLSKIVAIQLVLISNMNAQPSPPLPVDFGIDFITFTQGGPLEL